MKILLDENLPRRLKFQLKDHDASTVRDLGWNAFKNGILLKLMVEEQFDVFITADQNLEYQQNLKMFRIAIVVLIVPTLRYEDTDPLIPKLISLLLRVEPSKIYHLE